MNNSIPLTRVHQTLASIFPKGESLRARVFRGGAWLGTGSVAEQFFRFCRNVVLVRFLAPEAFGTMVIVLSTSAAIESFTEIGIKEAVVQSPQGRETEYLNGAWWLALGRAILLYGLIFAVAPWVAGFYHEPRLGVLLRVAMLGTLFTGAMSAKAFVTLKDMKFKRWAALYHGGGICGILVTVVLAFFVRGVWALAIGFVAEAAARCVLSYVLCPYMPGLLFKKDLLRGLLVFSSGVFGLPFLNFLWMRADIFVLGKMYSPLALGLYSMAVNLAQAPSGFVMNVLGQVMVPTFAEVQRQKARTNRILISVTSTVAFAGLPLLVFGASFGRSLITVAYGSRYSVMASAFAVAASIAMVNILNGLITTTFYAQGRPQLHRSFAIIRAGLMLVLIYPFVKWFGLVGAPLAGLASIGAGYLFQVVRVKSITGLTIAQYWKGLLLPLLFSLAVAPAAICAESFRSLQQPLPDLVTGLVGCGLAYALALAFFVWPSKRLPEPLQRENFII
ncbi:MAG TPA: oligosaccharide flippase family protein [Candidatus Acidoferrales bacterium]|nr:oligosaccharide flippase family protein [Candidatus Acidoferrales bacterium]